MIIQHDKLMVEFRYANQYTDEQGVEDKKTEIFITDIAYKNSIDSSLIGKIIPIVAPYKTKLLGLAFNIQSYLYGYIIDKGTFTAVLNIDKGQQFPEKFANVLFAYIAFIGMGVKKFCDPEAIYLQIPEEIQFMAASYTELYFGKQPLSEYLRDECFNEYMATLIELATRVIGYDRSPNILTFETSDMSKFISISLYAQPLMSMVTNIKNNC